MKVGLHLTCSKFTHLMSYYNTVFIAIVTMKTNDGINIFATA